MAFDPRRIFNIEIAGIATIVLSVAAVVVLERQQQDEQIPLLDFSLRETRMKTALEALSETFAAAFLWFMSARVRLRKSGVAKVGLETGLDDPRLLLRLIYEQSQWSAWAAVAAGLAAIFAIADGYSDSC